MTQLRSREERSRTGPPASQQADERRPMAPWDQQPRVARSSLGVLLAILAGCGAIGEVIWPGSAPQSESLNFWVPMVVVLGCAFLATGILADQHLSLARVVLVGGGALLLLSGLYFSVISGGGLRSAWALVADVGPGLCAIVAGLLIGRPRSLAPVD